MLNNGTIDSLLNSSFDDELPLMPMLTHLRFGKRISKEEIRGWNTNTNISPLEEKMKEKEKKVHLGIEKDHRRHETMRNIGPRHYERNSEKQEEKHQSAPFIPIFNCFGGLPDILDKKTHKAASEHTEDALDYVKGRKLECPPQLKRASLPKQLFSPFQVKSTRFQSARSLPHELNLTNIQKSARTIKRHGHRQEQSSIGTIFYPIDLSDNNRPQRQQLSAGGKLSIYMKKYHI